MAHSDGSRASVELTAAELQGPGVVFCPNPKMPLWSNHPRVFIDVATAGRRQVPVLRHGVPPQAGREGPRALIDPGASGP
jgi:uncharacterized Zn-finger protein